MMHLEVYINHLVLLRNPHILNVALCTNQTASYWSSFCVFSRNSISQSEYSGLFDMFLCNV